MGDSWLTDRCDQSCTCNVGGSITCKGHNCGSNAVCELDKSGDYICKPSGEFHQNDLFRLLCLETQTKPLFCFLAPLPGFDKCSISGDPHYRTFDRFTHHFQGAYTYILTQGHNLESNMPSLVVRGKNIRRGRNKRVSYLDQVYIDVYGVSVRFLPKKAVLVSSILLLLLLFDSIFHLVMTVTFCSDYCNRDPVTIL